MTQETLEKELYQGLNLSALMLNALGGQSELSLSGFENPDRSIFNHLMRFLNSKGIFHEQSAIRILQGLLNDNGPNNLFMDQLRIFDTFSEADFRVYIDGLEDSFASKSAQIVWINRVSLRKVGIRGYDISLYVLLSRLSFTCGLISEKELIRRVLHILPIAVSLFSDWQEYNDNVLLGNHYTTPTMQLDSMEILPSNNLYAAWHRMMQQEGMLVHPFKF
ncbi:DUF1266 domain-containing protein [Algoriphagus sp. NG3]|uniref:DUF1266 domain-containing protein n=1 Tax=Algoriphagus sp. NG3 TaxID=3097546 RepID=UPI002A80E395|nr:DUF1266 domain-containing protein [Algoriphagus sp. NG3]WPR75267.1 DUF1266 domain-containing protein [Algoriphagus sp. NG3]